MNLPLVILFYAIHLAQGAASCSTPAGFTQVTCENFDSGVPAGYTSNIVNSVVTGGAATLSQLIAPCGAFGNILGARSFITDITLTRTFTSQPAGHYKIVFDFAFLDHWSDPWRVDTAFLSVNGQNKWLKSVNMEQFPDGFVINQCNEPWPNKYWRDYKETVTVSFTLASPGNIVLVWSSSLDQSYSDNAGNTPDQRSWALAKLELYVQAECAGDTVYCDATQTCKATCAGANGCYAFPIKNTATDKCEGCATAGHVYCPVTQSCIADCAACTGRPFKSLNFPKNAGSNTCEELCPTIGTYEKPLCLNFENGLPDDGFTAVNTATSAPITLTAAFITQCGAFGKIFGFRRFGKDIALKRVLTSMPKGDYIFRFAYYFLDQWENVAKLTANGDTIWTDQFEKLTEKPFYPDQCGRNWGPEYNDKSTMVEATYTLAAAGTLTLEWTANFNLDADSSTGFFEDESFAISSFAVYITNIECTGTDVYCPATGTCKSVCVKTGGCALYPIRNTASDRCEACPLPNTYYCVDKSSCISNCHVCGFDTATDTAGGFCYEPVPSKILSLCPGVGTRVDSGSAIQITIAADSRVQFLDSSGAKKYRLKKQCGSEVVFTLVGSAVDMTTSTVTINAREFTLSPSHVLLPNCDYQLEWDDGALNVDLDFIVSGFKYQFTTKTATDTDVYTVGFITSVDPSEYSQDAMLNALGSVNCDLKPHLSVTVSAGSTAIYVRFTNLAPGTAALVAQFIAHVLSTWEFSTNLENRGLGTILVGSISVVDASADLLEDVVITNTKADAGTPSVVNIDFKASAPITAGYKLRVIFPDQWIVNTPPTATINGGTPSVGTMVTNPDAKIVEWTMPAGDATPMIHITGASLPLSCVGLNGWVWGIQLRNGAGDLLEFALTNPATDTCHGRSIVVFGDPHFLSFSGGYYDITGVAGTVYNIITDQHFVWNSMFVSDDRSMALHVVRSMQTFMGTTAFVIYDDFITMEPHSDEVLFNNKTIVKGYRYAIGNETNYYIKSKSGITIIRAPGFRVALKMATTHIVNKNTKNVHFDHAVDLITNEIVHPHGLLGQTATFSAPVKPVDHKGTGIVEGSLSEYALQHLLRTGYRYNRYGLSPSSLKQARAHWTYSWFNHLAIANGTLKADGFEIVRTTERSPAAFWVTHVESYLFMPLDNKKRRTTVAYLKHPKFEIYLTTQGKSVKEVSIETIAGEIFSINVEDLQIVLRNKQPLYRKTLVDMDAGIWVEEYPLSSTGVVLTFDKVFTLYLRQDNPTAPYFALQMEVYDPVVLASGASGILVEALKNPVVHMHNSMVKQAQSKRE